MTDFLINGVGDAEQALGPLIAACMATGCNGFEAINTLRRALENLAAKNYAPRQPLPPEYAEAIEETFGTCCEGDLGSRGNG